MDDQNILDNLKAFCDNVTSQNGEDGIITYLLDKFNISKGWCCEFGAWDGRHFSNTCNLWSANGFSAVLIEADEGRFNTLKANTVDHDDVIAVRAVVSYDPDSKECLDNILSGTPIPYDFDVLSIDIDGNDYSVWKALEKYKPKIVIIEVNSNHMPDVEIVNVLHDIRGIYWTCTSLKPMIELANSKGYELVAHIACNAIFVERSLYPLVCLKSNKIEDMYDYGMVRFR